MDYNKAQEEAINTIDGALLIISCPGSGKTTTMLRRIEHMIDVGVPAQHILMVTFTEAAAKEMKTRFQKTHPESPVTFCTLHSLCLRIINESGARQGYHIADAQELNEIVRTAVRNSGAYIEDLKKIKNDISRFKNTGDKKHRTEEALSDKQFMSVVKYYEDQKDVTFSLDFDDLLIVARELLESDEALRGRYSDRFKYVICDEYQDTNPIQKDVLYLLVQKHGNLCVVGDDDQSIYGFRGATPGLMIDFPNDFPGCKVIRMGTNYRSLPHIIEPAGELIRYNKKRFTKDIGANRVGDGEVHFESSGDREEEIESLIAKVKKLKAEGKKLTDAAILARTNQELEDVAEKLIEEKIPFIGKDALSDMYESWMFTDICSYLKIAEGDFTRRDLMRIANRPKRYLDMRVMSKCELSKDGIMMAYSGSKAYVMDKLFDFFYDLKQLKALPFSEKVDFILEHIGYRKYVASYCEAAGLSITIQDSRLNTFRDESKKFTSLQEWMAYANEHIIKFKEAVKKTKEDGVILATMHRSKGLEWDTVFIIDCCDGNIPLMHGGKVDDVEEERRLFYVACTRAKNELCVLSYDQTKNAKGKMTDVKPSAFLLELQRICKTRKAKAEDHIKAAEKAKKSFGDITLLDSPSLKKGAHVKHRTLGEGIVANVTPSFYTIRFSCGTKVFHAEGLMS